MRDVIKQSPLVKTAAEAAVLLALADWTTADGRSTYRSVAKLVADTRLGVNGAPHAAVAEVEAAAGGPVGERRRGSEGHALPLPGRAARALRRRGAGVTRTPPPVTVTPTPCHHDTRSETGIREQIRGEYVPTPPPARPASDCQVLDTFSAEWQEHRHNRRRQDEGRRGPRVLPDAGPQEAPGRNGASTPMPSRRRPGNHVWVFHGDSKPVEVNAFYDSWKTACGTAKVPGRLIHDLRRTAIRNLVRAGVSEAVAMKMCGHKTRSIFDRYNVSSEKDLKAASALLSAHHKELAKQAKAGRRTRRHAAIPAT